MYRLSDGSNWVPTLPFCGSFLASFSKLHLALLVAPPLASITAIKRHVRDFPVFFMTKLFQFCEISKIRRQHQIFSSLLLRWSTVDFMWTLGWISMCGSCAPFNYSFYRSCCYVCFQKLMEHDLVYSFPCPWNVLHSICCTTTPKHGGSIFILKCWACVLFYFSLF